MKRMCPFCGKMIELVTEEEKGKYIVRFEPIQVKKITSKCPECKSKIFVMDEELKNIEKATRDYLGKRKLPSPEELGLCRRRLNKTVKEMAKILGCNVTIEEIKRMEKGMIGRQLVYERYKELFKECNMD
ncbi:hypothetical protein [Anaeromusa acidaminophila]|uniref:hypothetical protein n=1 Tax=Anaeromusa acidaminophila TaxID=81464 RepID=UPI00037F2EE4|nr:hypothetical protein [Anaeromusa acidaminophila]